jgi:hypothetical protein
VEGEGHSSIRRRKVKIDEGTENIDEEDVLHAIHENSWEHDE